MQKPWSPEAILELGWAYQRSQPLLAAAELGVFQAIGPDQLTASRVARKLDADERGMEALLNALAGQGLVIKSREEFSLPEEIQVFLSDDPETSVLPMILHQANCATRWDRLVDVVKTGKPPSDVSGFRDDPEKRRRFIQAMHVIGRSLAGEIVAALSPERFRHALDVGGASGTYTIALLRAVPEMRVTLFDLPPVVEMARERLSAENLLDRVRLVAGDFYEDALPAGHDLVLLSAIIHQNSREENRRLYAKSRDGLEPGGTIVIRDILMDDTHTKPVGGAMFAINMLVATEGGGTYSYSEVREDLEAAGFVDVEMIQKGRWMDGLVSAKKPA